MLGNTVVLSYRGGVFGRATPSNRACIERLTTDGRLTVLPRSRVIRITPGGADLDVDAIARSIDAERIYVMIGGELPGAFLASLGIEVDVKFGTV